MREIALETEDGLTLEARVDGPGTGKAGLVLCHPHPQMGGTMKAPLLGSITDHLVALDWDVLRFNFRGIGASQGESGIGRGEVKDAAAAVEWAVAEWSERPRAIAGWSFGAAVAVKVASGREDLAACVAIAPAVKAKPGITAGLPPPEEVSLLCPSLFIVGANDEVTPPQHAREWAEGAGIELLELPAANHLFWGRYEQLASTVGGFLEKTVGGM